MFELGAGWGPWVTFAAKACLLRGKQDISITGVEGQEESISNIKEMLTINGFRKDNSELVQEYGNIKSKIMYGVVADKNGYVDFEVRPAVHFNSSILNSSSASETKRVPSFTIESLIQEHDVVDYIHIDIQGFEIPAIKASINAMNEKVRFLLIGTHSRKIEGDLLELLLENNWELLREFPCLFNYDITSFSNLVNHTHLDGAQFWKNSQIVL